MKDNAKPVFEGHPKSVVNENRDRENILSVQETRLYEKPIIEIISIDFCDIITVSNNWETDPFPIDDNMWDLPDSDEF